MKRNQLLDTLLVHIQINNWPVQGAFSKLTEACVNLAARVLFIRHAYTVHTVLHTSLLPDPGINGRAKNQCIAHVTQCGRISSAIVPQPLIIRDPLHLFVINLFGAHASANIFFFFF